MSEIKLALKDAKNAIKEKNFKAGLAHCKSALKIDRKNYVALAMFGKICQELNNYEDSKKSLQLCTQLDPDQPIAWQGLYTLHEKCPQIFGLKETLDLLKKVATLTDDEEKLKLIAKRQENVIAEENKIIENKISEKVEEDSPVEDEVTEINDEPSVPEVSKEELVQNTWNSIKIILSNKFNKSDKIEELLESLLFSLAELTIGGDTNIKAEDWLQVGIYYLENNSIEKAIRALQLAVKMDSNNSMIFECLGDSFLLRGSYNAALKLYTRAVDLSSVDGLYPKRQIAYIKQITGDFLGSMSDYESLLKLNPPKFIYTVALVGLAEVLLSRARKYHQQSLLSNVKRECMHAMHCLSLVASEYPHHVTVWKLLSDACSMQAGLPPSISSFKVPSNLVKISDSEQTFEHLDKKELLQLGGRFLAVALKLCKEDCGLWHDLGVNLFLQRWHELSSTSGKWAEENPIHHRQLDRALSCIKKSLTLDSRNSNVWNSLGVVAAFIDDNSLAQHCFLKSLEIRASPEVWTHLGVLYFKQKNENLAYEAFSRAQGLDPAYVPCWVGQGMVAESVGHEETFNLFRHTTILGVHPESCIGHASHVIKSVGEGWKMINDTLIQNASDSMIFYSRDKELDPVGLNMCGLLLEMVSLPKSSEKYFRLAVDACEENPNVPSALKDAIYANYGRILLSLNKAKEAIGQLSMIKESDFYSECAVALAKMKDGNFESAYETYSSALCWLSPDDSQKSHVLVAMALIQYKFKRMEQVKTLLFQSSCSSESSVQSLVSLAALGLLGDDRNLFAASLSELEKFSDDKEHVYKICFLKAAFAALKNDFKEAKLIVCLALHKHPQMANMWRFLAQLLLAETRNSATDRLKAALGSKAAASNAMALSQSSGKKDNIQLDVTLKAMSSVIAEKEQSVTAAPKKQRKSKKKEELPVQPKIKSICEAQRAVLMCPAHMETWAVLVSALKDNKMKKKFVNNLSKRTTGELHSWLQGTKTI